MGKFILFFLSCFYLAIEYLFNVNLVNIIGNNELHNYQYVDIIGRYVSSFGGTLLVLRFIVFSKKDIVLKCILSFTIIPFVFWFLFIIQEKAVNIISDYTSNPVKKTQVYTYIYKKGVADSNAEYNIIPRKNKDITIEDHVYFTSVLFWGFGYDKFIEFAKKEDENKSPRAFQKIFSKDFDDSRRYYFMGYYHASLKVREFYNIYINKSAEYKNKLEKTKKNVRKGWRTKKENQKKLIRGYTDIKRKLKKDISKNASMKSLQVYDNFYLLSGCGTYSCFKSVEKIIKRQGYNVEDYCRFNTYGKYNEINYSSHYLSRKKIKRKSQLRKFSEFGSFSCFLDFRNDESVVVNKIYRDAKEKYGISDFSFENSRDFSRSQELNNALIYMAKKKYNINLPYNWVNSDKKTFNKYYLLSVKGKLDRVYKDEMIKNFGFHIPLGLKRNEFFKNKKVQSYLDTFLGVYGNNKFELDLNEREFYEKYKKHMDKELGIYYKENINNSEFVDSIFKLTIVPIIGITFSLIFGIINLSLILRDVFCYLFRIKCRKIEILSLFCITFCLFYIPMTIDNYYTQHQNFNKVFSSFQDTNIFMAYFYKWFLNTETIVYSLSNTLYLDMPFVKDNYLGSKF